MNRQFFRIKSIGVLVLTLGLALPFTSLAADEAQNLYQPRRESG